MSEQTPPVFELCAQTLPACLAANVGGAHRIELCSALETGGLTPELALVEAVVRQSTLPIYVLLRPVADSFRTSTSVLAALRSSLQSVQCLGVAGVVLGLLHENGTVDVPQTSALVRMAAPLPVTFHRAFDATPDLFQALEDVIATGCTRVLTSGGAADVLTGAPTLARLIRQAGDRIDVAVGGGLRLENAEAVARITAARHFHGSLRVSHDDTNNPVDPPPERIRQAIRLLTAGRRASTDSAPSAGGF